MEPTILSSIAKVALGKVIVAGLQFVTRHLDADVAEISASDAAVSSAITRHLEMLDNWSSKVSFRDLQKPRPLFDIYVDLDLQLTPKRLSLSGDEPRAASVDKLLDLDENCVLLGDAGAGKTTSVKRLVKYAIAAYQNDPAHHPIPLLVLLGELHSKETLTEKILSELGITFIPGKRTNKSAFGSHANESTPTRYIADQVLTKFLSAVRVRLFLDGLDEVPGGLVEATVKELQQLLLRITPSKALLTCRSAAFVGSLHDAHVFEIRALEDSQIRTFVSRWLNDPVQTSAFFKQLDSATYRDTAVRPLTLALYCALFQRYGRIPDRSRTAWKKIVRLLLDDWDADEHLVSRPSRYANFESDRKEEFLERLSFELGKSTFSHQDLELAYRVICADFSLPKNESMQVAREIESHSGLVVQNAFESYQFAHKSIQEYLAAQYIVKSLDIPAWPAAVTDRPDEYAIAVALSSRPSRYLAALAFGPLSKASDQSGVAQFLDRLIKEKPDFTVDPVLGAAILVLATIAESPKPTESVSRVRKSLNSMLQNDNIAQSVADAHRHFEVVERQSDLLTLHYRGSLPPEARAEIANVLRVGSYLFP